MSLDLLLLLFLRLGCLVVGASTKDVRTGINATGIRLETASGPVFLFFTGRHHAGEVLDRLLEHRKPTPDSPRLVKVTDGASKNFDHRHREELVEAACNAHAFLNFRDIKNKHPVEYALAGRVYKAVFDNNDMAKQRRLSPEDRRLFHREHSKPLMEELKAMCEEKLRNKLVEPNSALWESLSFIISQWPRLTHFYEVPVVPLDSSLVEQSLIIPVRYLAASFNYQTETGAEVGDRMMSLIATARANGVEPVAYLTHCLRNHGYFTGGLRSWGYRTVPRTGADPAGALSRAFLKSNDDAPKSRASSTTSSLFVQFSRLQDNQNVVAFTYGPLVLSAGLGTDNRTLSSAVTSESVVKSRPAPPEPLEEDEARSRLGGEGRVLPKSTTAAARRSSPFLRSPRRSTTSGEKRAPELELLLSDPGARIPWAPSRFPGRLPS